MTKIYAVSKLAAQIEQEQEKMYYVRKDYDSSTIDV
jgi:hypothetical protein